MVSRIYMMFLSFLSFLSMAHASDFMFNLTYKKNLGPIKLKTTLFVFMDGTYLLHTSSGGIGLCQDDGKAGMFKGKLSIGELKEIEKKLDIVSSECQKSAACVVAPNDKEISTFTITDYRPQGKRYSFSEVESILLNDLIDKANSFKEVPIRSLSINVQKEKITLNYAGENYKTAVGVENFLVLLKSGAYVALKEFSKHHHKSKTVSFNRSKSSYSFMPKLDWNKLKSEGNFLIYTNKNDAHHLDPKKKVYTPCIPIH